MAGRTPPVGSITILRCAERGRRATKLWRRDPITGVLVKEGFDPVTWFWAEQRPVSGIDDLSQLLNELERDPTAFIIRGQPAPGVDLSKRVRRKSTRTGQPVRSGSKTC